MNTTENCLAELLTGCDDTDVRIRAAFDMGLRRGKEQDREGLKLNAQIQTTKKLLNSLMATQHIDLQAAMNALRIPRVERKTYVKLWTEAQKNKQAVK